MADVPEIPQGSVIITPDKVYEKVMQLTEQVTQLVTKQQNSTIDTDVADLKNRVRALEQKVWMAAGAAATLGSGVGAFLSSKLGS